MLVVANTCELDKPKYRHSLVNLPFLLIIAVTFTFTQTAMHRRLHSFGIRNIPSFFVTIN